MSPLELGLWQRRYVHDKNSFFSQVCNKQKKNSVQWLEAVKLISTKRETWMKAKFNLGRGLLTIKSFIARVPRLICILMFSALSFNKLKSRAQTEGIKVGQGCKTLLQLGRKWEKLYISSLFQTHCSATQPLSQGVSHPCLDFCTSFISTLCYWAFPSK